MCRGTCSPCWSLHDLQVWERLVWRGKHAQAPVAVAAKPHYFGELDVVASVAALGRADGGALWRSPEVREAVERGGLVELDPDFFAQARDWLVLGSRGWGAGDCRRFAQWLHEPRPLCARQVTV